MEELDDDNSTQEIININKRNPNNLYTINLKKDLESFIKRSYEKMDFNFLNHLPNNILELTLYGDEVCVYNPIGPNKSEGTILHICVRINNLRSSKLECIRTYGLMKAKYSKKYGYRNLTEKCICRVGQPTLYKIV